MPPGGSRDILQTYSWHLSLGDKDPDKVMTTMRELASRLIRVRPVLRGMKLSPLDTGKLHVQLRVAGHTRWEIQRDARKLIVLFLRRAFIHPTALELELVTTQRNGRELYLGEGRTPMTRRPRSATRADGTPWDDYEWWGDELPTVDPSTGASREGESGEPASAVRDPWTPGPRR